MNTDKVKNIIIILLAVLNAALFVLLMAEFGRFRLGGGHVAAIRVLFEQNDIAITADIPRNFRPQRVLYVQPFVHDRYAHAEVFFPGGANQTPEVWGRITFFDGDETLEITGLYLGNYVLTYTNETGFSTTEFLYRSFDDYDAVLRLADEFVRRITPPGLMFVHTYTNVFYDDEFATLWFRGYYGGYIIRDNQIRISISNNGIFWAQLNFANIPHGFSRERREIISADEALFVVLHHLTPMYEENEVVVYAISMAYFMPDLADSPTGEELITATPCYRIVVEIDGIKQTFWVDAFTNERLD